MPTNDEILATEFSPRFVELMQNRMIMSYYKYGLLTDAYPEKVNAISSLTERLHKYAETGNTEWLVDVANFCMIEFMHPRHTNAHFEGTDDEASPGRVTGRGARLDKRDNKSIGTNPDSKTVRFRE